MNCNNNRHPWAIYLALFLVGILLLFLRNPDPLLNPVVYAEDGFWASIGLREGWLTALLYSRTDYFVFIQTILIYIASMMATASHGGLIDYLPYTIAGVSYAFYAAFALLVFASLPDTESLSLKKYRVTR